MSDKPLFPQIPKDLTDLDDDQLAQHRDELQAAIREVAAHRRDPDVVGDRTQADVAEEMAEAVLALKTVQARIDELAAEEAAYDAKVEELANEAGVDPTAEAPEEETTEDEAPTEGDETTETEEETTETETEEAPAETEAVAASARKQLARKPAIPAARRRHRPAPSEMETRGLRLSSQAANQGIGFESQAVLNRRDVGEVMTDLINRRIRPGERLVIASANFDYPDRLTLDKTEGHRNQTKIEAEVERLQKEIFTPALVASGAPCAPLTPIYDLPGVETSGRPVRDALPAFQANRAGVIVGATPLLGDYAGAVGVVTAEENAAGGTSAVKHCMRVECPEFESVIVDSIYSCYEMDNLGGRAYPELMSRVEELIRAEQARLADSRILTALSAGASASLTGGFITQGAVVSLMGDVYAAAAQYRSSNRMSPTATLQAIFPFWVVDLLALDFVSGQFDREKTRADIDRLLRSANIVPVFSLDGSETASDGQVFARATDGSLDGFPASVEWFLFAPGTWLFLDSGQLDLGVVRDSTLNATNDFQVFYETWENVVKVGGDSYAITTDVCPSGVVSLPDAPSISCAND